jgi:hypothetical protein
LVIACRPSGSGKGEAGVEVALRRITEQLRRYCGPIPKPELAGLAAELFLESARVALAWVED